MARYNLDGSLDPTFDGDGRVVTDFGGTDVASAVAIQSDGKIVAAGSTSPGAAQDDPSDFALARYNPNGSLDTSFDGDGRVVTDFFGLGGVGESASDVAIQTDSKIVAVGSGGSPDFAVARYNLNGSLDGSFDGDGRVVTDMGAEFDNAFAVAIQADGNIVVAGESGQRGPDFEYFALARYKPDGSLDPAFAGDGTVLTDFGQFANAFAITIQADAKLVAAGRVLAQGGYNFALARYNLDGTLDSNFGDSGKVATDFGRSDSASDVAIQADGQLVAVGGSSSGTQPGDFALARYVPTGTAKPKVSIGDATSFEGNAGATAFAFTVKLSRPSAQTVTVSRRTVAGSATAPSDYTALAPATLTFTPGQTSKSVIVKVNGDIQVEPSETFFVKLSNPTNATIDDGSGQGTIVNDDLSASAACTIVGTVGDDVLNGTPGNDVICAGNGDDQLYGFGGNDVLKGENGNDLLVGSDGFDLLVGSTGADDLRAGTGNDALRGGDNGDDKLHGGTGSDALFGNDGTDSLDSHDGVSANDGVDGGNGSDSCIVDSGDFLRSCP